MLGVQTSGLGEAQAMIKMLPKETEKALAGPRLRKAAQVLRTFWQLKLSGPRSGRRLGVVTGALRSSIQVVRRDRLTVAVGTPLPYARIHEFGGAAGSPNATMPKRPHRAPAIRMADRPMRKILGGAAEEGAKMARRKAKRVRATQRDMVQRAN